MTALMLVGGLAEVLLSWLDGTLQVTREQLIDDCADLFVATGESAIALVRDAAPGAEPLGRRPLWHAGATCRA